MTLRHKTNDELVADIRRDIDRGYVAATVERIRSLAFHREEADFLRQLVGILADAIEAPPKRSRQRPRKNAPSSVVRTTRLDDGSVEIVFDADKWIPLTRAEQRASIRKLMRAMSVKLDVDEICERNHCMTKTGAIREAARALKMSESEARKLYYGEHSR